MFYRLKSSYALRGWKGMPGCWSNSPKIRPISCHKKHFRPCCSAMEKQSCLAAC